MKVVYFLHVCSLIHNNGILISHDVLRLQRGFMVVSCIYKGVFGDFMTARGVTFV